MAYLAPGMGLAAGLGAYPAYDWRWAALLALVGVIAGAGIGFGWFGPLLMIPYAATFVVPEASGRNATVYGVVVGIATLYGVVVARRFGVGLLVAGLVVVHALGNWLSRHAPQPELAPAA
jgi:hypothetical protein